MSATAWTGVAHGPTQRPQPAGPKILIFVVFVLCGLSSALTNRSMDPMLTEIARDFAVPVTTAALLSSAYAFPYAFSQPVLGPIGDFYGKSLVLRVCLWLLTACLLACYLAPNFPLLLGFRLIGGIAAGGIMPVTMAMIGDRFEPARRQLVIGRFLMAGLTGTVFGASIAGLMAVTVGWRSFLLLVAAFAFSAAVGATILLREKSGRPQTHIRLSDAVSGYGRVFSNPKSYLCFGTVFVEGALFYGATPYIGELLEAAHLGSAKEAGFVLGAFGIGGICYSLTLPITLRIMRRPTMMAIGGILASSGLLGVAMALPWYTQAFLFGVSGLGFLMLHNSVQAEVAELAPTARASSFSMHSFSFFLGQAIGPILVGALLHGIGRGTLVLNAMVLALTGIVVSRLFRRYRTASGSFG
jgi:predicted MFS family arabinose efflux permease